MAYTGTYFIQVKMKSGWKTIAERSCSKRQAIFHFSQQEQGRQYRLLQAGAVKNHDVTPANIRDELMQPFLTYEHRGVKVTIFEDSERWWYELDHPSFTSQHRGPFWERKSARARAVREIDSVIKKDLKVNQIAYYDVKTRLVYATPGKGRRPFNMYE